jgi:hypothetical protein
MREVLLNNTNMKNGAYFASNGRLGNQLSALFHAYAEYPNLENLYFPHMKEYQEYFKCNKFRDEAFYNNFKEYFHEIDWHNLKDYGNVLRFPDFHLREEHQKKVNDMVAQLGTSDLVAVHIRHGDYKEWCNGEFYFNEGEYLDAANKAVESWGLRNPKIVIFSDEKRDVENFSWNITGGNAVYDMFVMSHFNYFVRTYSTFSGLAAHISKCRGLFEGEIYIPRK